MVINGWLAGPFGHFKPGELRLMRAGTNVFWLDRNTLFLEIVEPIEKQFISFQIGNILNIKGEKSEFHTQADVLN